MKIRTANKKGYVEAEGGDGIDLAYPQSKTRRGRVAKGMIMTLDTADNKGVAIREIGKTIRTSSRGSHDKHEWDSVNDGLRIRKLTPKECWRLMGFDDEDFDKAKASGVSNSQLYKQAGNSIVVSVLQAITKNLFKEEL